MAKMQNNIKDYLGSEISTINALQTLIPLKKHKQIYSAYNNLGIIYNELGEFEQSLEFHKKALETERNLNGELLKASSYNNIGVVYLNMNQYELSIEYFKMAIKIDSLYSKNTVLYAMLVDNMAYSRLKLKDTLKLENDFFRALRIRDSIDHKAGVIINHLHLGEYFLYKQDTIKALKQIQMAKSLSEKYHSNGDLMESLLFLAKIDTNNSEHYYSTYISLSDSLHNEERAIRNKFTRIRFETNEFIAENEQLNFQNRWIILGFSGLVFIIISVFVIIFQRKKNKELVLIQQQLKSNEEIYNLLIDSQNKLDEGKEEEKKRISKELHDGVLSKFFGVRLNLELLNNGITNESIAQRENYTNELKQLENEIRTVSHQLNEDMFSTENSFKTIVEELINSQKIFDSFQCKLDLDKNIVWDDISSKIKINVYRIIQEALHNIIKHSVANLVELIFIKENKSLKVEMKDDGVGFNTNANSNGIGLGNMRLRVKDIGGEIQIKSSNSGTEIIMYIPYQK
jgi:signal transduction histidine kinase